MSYDEPVPEADRLPDVAAGGPLPTTEDAGPSPMEEFWNKEPSLDNEVAMIVNSPSLLTDEQLSDLHTILSHYLPQDNGYGANFDFKREISAQLSAVRAMRAKVMTSTGQIKENIPTREVKEALSAANTLTASLMKNHEKIMNFDRQRALEQATIAAIEAMSDEIKEIFFNDLNARLEKLE